MAFCKRKRGRQEAGCGRRQSRPGPRSRGRGVGPPRLETLALEGACSPPPRPPLTLPVQAAPPDQLKMAPRSLVPGSLAGMDPSRRLARCGAPACVGAVPRDPAPLLCPRAQWPVSEQPPVHAWRVASTPYRVAVTEDTRGAARRGDVDLAPHRLSTGHWPASPFHCIVAMNIRNSLPSAHLKRSPCSPYRRSPPRTHAPGPAGAAPSSAVQPLPLAVPPGAKPCRGRASTARGGLSPYPPCLNRSGTGPGSRPACLGARVRFQRRAFCRERGDILPVAGESAFCSDSLREVVSGSQSQPREGGAGKTPGRGQAEVLGTSRGH